MPEATPEPEDLVDDLAGGRASALSVRLLWTAQTRKRLLLLRLLMSIARERQPDEADAADLAQAYTRLADLQRAEPALIARMISMPEVGTWLGYALHRLENTPEPSSPLWPELGYLGWLAAAATLRSRRLDRQSVVVRNGEVMLPGSGLARLTLDGRTGRGELESLTDGRFSLRLAEHATESTTAAGAADSGWYPLRRLRTGPENASPNGNSKAGGYTVRLDDLDPFRDPDAAASDTQSTFEFASRLTDEEYALWDSRFAEAFGLMAEHMPGYADSVAEWLRTVRPIVSARPGLMSSNTSPSAFGCIELTAPPDAVQLVRTLVHEFQHAVLGALTDYTTLTVPSSRQFYAPWRGEMRPAENLLQGIYAHIGVLSFLQAFGKADADAEYPALREDLTQCVHELASSGVLTAEGEAFVDRLRRTEALHPSVRVPGTATPRTPAPPSRTRELLPAYFDLTSDRGPLHNRALADLGRSLRAGRALTAYQSLSAVWMRPSIHRDCPDLPVLRDPRELPAQSRSPEWDFLCRRLDDWNLLAPSAQADTAVVLTKLGFWHSMARLPVDHDVGHSALESRRVAYLHCTALLNVHGTDPQAGHDARGILAGIAADTELQTPARLSAAINLIVLHARSHQPRQRLRFWQDTASRLVDEASPNECGRLLMSAYWRAVSFIPFLEGDHGETQDMLGEAERLAQLAVVEAAQGNRYVVAAETLGLVLDTRGRAAEAAGDADQALRCCRDSTELDPLDSKALVRLADCLLWTGDVDGARRAYADAAHLGAPYTSYASAQFNRLAGGAAPGEAACRSHHRRARTRGSGAEQLEGEGMIGLTDALVGWLVSVIGDAGTRLVWTSRDERRLRQLMSEALDSALGQADPSARPVLEQSVLRALASPGRLLPGPGRTLTETLHDTIRTRLEGLELASGADPALPGGEPEPGPVSAPLAERVANAVISAIRQYVAVSGLEEFVHGLDTEELSGRLDALSQQIEGLTVAARASATFTLPGDITTFTGRNENLQRLLEAGKARAAGGTARVFGLHAIDGMAGIGKTALAVHASHLLARHYPDGQVFLHLHGHTPGQLPVDPAAALVTLLLTVGTPPGSIPPGLEARAALWRDYVGTKKMLILLDDAISSEQVRPLLPGSPESLVIITSRRRLIALNEVESMSLDTLAPGEATELFVRVAARPTLAASDPAVTELVRLCGYLPLAIRLTAAQLAHHSSWSIESLVADLASTRDRTAAMRAETDSVTSAFDLSYHDLNEAQQLVFRRLGLHTGSEFDAYITAALCELDLPAAERLLDELFIHHLIEEPRRGRYLMHDLIRQQARDLASRDGTAENEAAVHRLLDYFLTAAASAADHVVGRMPLPPMPPVEFPPAWVPDLPTAKEALAWLQTERANLHGAVDYAASRVFPVHAVFIPSAMQHFLRSQGYWDEVIALQTAAGAVAHRVNDRPGEALALRNLGQVQRMSGRYAPAITSLERALEVHRELGAGLEEAYDLHEIGLARRFAGDYSADAVCQNAAREIYRELGNKIGEANAEHELGVMQWLIGDLPASLETHSRGRDLYRETGNEYGLAHAYNELAVVQNSAGRYSASAANLATALELHRRLGSRVGEGYALMFLGTMQYLTGDHAASIETLTQAVELDRELGNRYAMGFALRELGVAQARSGDLAKAHGTLLQAIALDREVGNRYGEGCALTSLSRVQMLNSDFAQARSSLDGASAIHRGLGHRLAAADTLLAEGELLLYQRAARDARERFTRALDIARESQALLEDARAVLGLARCSMAEGDLEGGSMLLNDALETFRRIGAPDATEVERLLAG